MRRMTGRSQVCLSGVLLGLAIAFSHVACSSKAPEPSSEPLAAAPEEPAAAVPEPPPPVAAPSLESVEAETTGGPASPSVESALEAATPPSEPVEPESIPAREVGAAEAIDEAPVESSGQPVPAPADVAAPAAPQPATTGVAYVGSQACKKCHFAQFQSWQRTRMAKALDSLKPGDWDEAKLAAGLDPSIDYTTDPNCLPCHTVGFGRPGGFTSVADTPDLAGVGCESCHGPGADYLEIMTLQYKDHRIAEMAKRGLVYPPTSATCVECHNADSPFNASIDPKYAFNFDERVRLDEGSHAHKPLKGSHPDLAELKPVFQEAP